MKHYALIILALTMASLTAQARLGQTLAEVEKQYGKPTLAPYTVEYVYRDYGDKQALYEKNGIKFLVVFKAGKSQFESITKKDTNDSLTHSEVTAFLSANSGGATWVAPKEIIGSTTKWTRDDGGASAYLTDDQKTLTVKITSGGSKGF